jgi:Alw26I/Eco31I/Esp3I family type II restriction m6 adenine DNA methyltransferase
LRHHAEFYNTPGNEKQAKKDGCVSTDDRIWRLSLMQRRTILLNNVYGVDIDRQATEVAQLSLFLKLLEDERATSARQYQLDYARDRHLKTLLPDLTSNIVCGNSLIGWEVAGLLGLDPEEETRLNPLDFESAFRHVMLAGGFDVIVGNPPYEVVEKERSQASWPHQDFVEAIKNTSQYAAALGGKLNMFRFFIVRAISLVRIGGKTGMIVPLSLVADISCAKTRAFLIQALRPVEMDCFPQKDNAKRRIFKDAKLSTMIFTGQRGTGARQKVDLGLRVYPWNSFEDEPRTAALTLSEMATLDPVNLPIPLVSDEQWTLCQKLYHCTGVKRLSEVDGVSVTRGEINQTNYRKFITDNPTHSRLVKGVEIGRYQIRSKLSQGSQEWFDEKAFLREHAPKPVVNKHRIATQRITGVDERLRIVCTVIAPLAYFADSTNSIVVADNSPVAMEFLVAVLNSKLMQWRFKLTSTNNNVGTNELDSLPISFADRISHDRVVELARQLIAAKQQESESFSHSKEVATRKCEALDRQIDSVIYELYGLTQDEIRLVELAA